MTHGLRGAVILLCVVLSAQVYADDGVEITVTAPYIEMHTGPGRGYPVFHVVEKGGTLRLTKNRTDWYKGVTPEGKEGWISSADLHGAVAQDGVALDFAPPEWEDYLARNWELGLLGGTFEGARDLTVYLGYRLTPNLSTELKYTQAFGDFSDSKLASLNIVHQPFPTWRVSPFFTLGAGAIKTSPSATLVETEDREDNLLTVGGGAFFYVSRRFLFRAEYNHHTLLTSRENNEEVEEWKAGFSVFF